MVLHGVTPICLGHTGVKCIGYSPTTLYKNALKIKHSNVPHTIGNIRAGADMKTTIYLHTFPILYSASLWPSTAHPTPGLVQSKAPSGDLAILLVSIARAVLI